MLVLNHKRASEYLWANRALTTQNMCAMHGLLTDNHALDEVAESDHFLPEGQRSKPQEYEDVNLGTSRLAANTPLLGAGLLPFSFSDVDRANYIRGMAAFYQLGSMYVIEQTFIHRRYARKKA